MPVSDQLIVSGSVGGAPVNNATIDISSDGAIQQAVDVPKASVGTLSTRTDDDTGVATVPTGHGVIAADLITLFFAGGHRRDVVVDSVTGTTITFGTVTPGAGDNLPAQDDPITVCKQVDVNVDFVGNDVIAIMATCGARAVIGFMASGTRQKNVELKAGNGRQWHWISADGGGATNPLSAVTVDQVRVAHEAASQQTVRLGVNYDSTP